MCFSVEPDEVLLDGELEARAREISSELRCLVCRNENIDSSNAELARDLRILVRERLVLGETNEQVLSFLENRYGNFILLKPKFQGFGLVLWLLGPFVFLLGCGLVIIYIRRQNKNIDYSLEQKDLSSSELKRLNEFLNRE